MQRFLRFLLGFFILFVIYNTLIPFRLISGSEQFYQHIDQIQYFDHLSLTDIAGNILLFIPFGFLIGILLKHRSVIFRLSLTVLAGFIFSLAIEFTQLFFLSRTTSLVDLINNTFGTFIGVVAAIIFSGNLEERLYNLLKNAAHSQPLTIIVALIFVTHVFGAIVPFNVTITVSDLKKSFKKANIGILSYKPLGDYFGLKVKPDKTDKFGELDFIGDVLYFMIYGFLLALCFDLYWRKEKQGFLIFVFLALILFPMVEIIQFFIRSRVTDINDIIAGYAGVGLGISLLKITSRQDKKEPAGDGRALNLSLPIFIYLFYLLYSGLKPFQFSLDADVLKRDLQFENLVPFYSYFKKTTIWNIYDLAETGLAFTPFAFILNYLAKNKLSAGQLLIRTVLLSLAIGLVIEVGQLFLEERVGEITDVMVYVLGGYSGVLLFRWYHSEFEREDYSGTD